MYSTAVANYINFYRESHLAVHSSGGVEEEAVANWSKHDFPLMEVCNF